MIFLKLKIHVNMFKKCTAVSERNINKTHCPAREGRHTTPFFRPTTNDVTIHHISSVHTFFRPALFTFFFKVLYIIIFEF